MSVFLAVAIFGHILLYSAKIDSIRILFEMTNVMQCSHCMSPLVSQLIFSAMPTQMRRQIYVLHIYLYDTINMYIKHLPHEINMEEFQFLV